MLAPVKRARDLPFVNSVCDSQGAHLAVFLMKSTQILYETCVWIVFSVMSWLLAAETVALASNKRCEANGAKDANALEAHEHCEAANKAQTGSAAPPLCVLSSNHSV